MGIKNLFRLNLGENFLYILLNTCRRLLVIDLGIKNPFKLNQIFLPDKIFLLNQIVR